jgi:sulfatase modifying factor 1
MKRLTIIIFILCFIDIGALFAQKDEKPSKITNSKDGSEMVLIPAGEFQMGSNTGFSNEKPVHKVYLDDFYIDKNAITNAQYKKFVKATKHREPKGKGPLGGDWKEEFKPWSDPNFNKDNQPIVCISWDDAKAYAKWAGKRLLTEAEWEKAARGRLVDKKYAWGDELPPPNKTGNFADLSLKKVFKDWTIVDKYDDGYIYPAPVGSFKPNGYGLYDMSGNVWEWCADLYSKGYYENSPSNNPKGPSSGSSRIVRGISWCLANPKYLNVSFRYFLPSGHALNYVGFRCAK